MGEKLQSWMVLLMEWQNLFYSVARALTAIYESSMDESKVHVPSRTYKFYCFKVCRQCTEAFSIIWQQRLLIFLEHLLSCFHTFLKQKVIEFQQTWKYKSSRFPWDVDKWDFQNLVTKFPNLVYTPNLVIFREEGTFTNQ